MTISISELPRRIVTILVLAHSLCAYAEDGLTQRLSSADSYAQITRVLDAARDEDQFEVNFHKWLSESLRTWPHHKVRVKRALRSIFDRPTVWSGAFRRDTIGDLVKFISDSTATKIHRGEVLRLALKESPQVMRGFCGQILAVLAEDQKFVYFYRILVEELLGAEDQQSFISPSPVKKLAKELINKNRFETAGAVLTLIDPEHAWHFVVYRERKLLRALNKGKDGKLARMSPATLFITSYFEGLHDLPSAYHTESFRYALEFLKNSYDEGSILEILFEDRAILDAIVIGVARSPKGSLRRVLEKFFSERIPALVAGVEVGLAKTQENRLHALYLRYLFNIETPRGSHSWALETRGKLLEGAACRKLVQSATVPSNSIRYRGSIKK
jgi:hypothetical protein